jgi:hypothetical protein
VAVAVRGPETSPFESWLNAEMAARGIRSAGWLAREVGLDATQVADWMLGRAVPDDAACARLAAHWGLPEQAVRTQAVPLPRRPR